MNKIYYFVLSVCFCSLASAQELRKEFYEEDQALYGDAVLLSSEVKVVHEDMVKLSFGSNTISQKINI